MGQKIVADTHIHSIISHDGSSELSMLCRAALENGVSVICLTDHCDTEFSEKADFWQEVDFSVDSVHAIRAVSQEAGVSVMVGTELGQSPHFPDVATKVAQRHDYDHIIMSQHITYDAADFYFLKRERFLEEGELLMRRYFDDLIVMVNQELGDVLGHLTYPLRYFLREGVECDITKYYDRIEELFRLMIKKEMALECNTSGLRQPIGITLPNEPIFRLYHELGGRLVTLGSDAHLDKEVGSGIAEGSEMLKRIGFAEAVYYEKRKPVMYPL